MRTPTSSVRIRWPLCLALLTAAGLCGCGADAITPDALPPMIGSDLSVPKTVASRGSGTTLEPPEVRGVLERRMPLRTAGHAQGVRMPRTASARSRHPHRGRGRGGQKPTLVVVEFALEKQQ